MKLTIWVKQEIEVPGEAIPILYRKTNEWWEKSPEEPVHPQDLLITAMRDRTIRQIEEEWRVDDMHDEWISLSEWCE